MKRRWSFWVMIVSACWVFYNTIFSGSILYFDALGYDQLGSMLSQGHWADYLSGGPQREPLYPLFVALHIKLSGWLQLPYIPLLLLTQGLVLLLTQAMMATIFTRIRLSDGISALFLAYFVLSPTVLRSSLIVYSEIITYPLMLLPLLAAFQVWHQAGERGGFQKRVIRYALYVGGSFIGIVFVKGIFELIAPACIVLFSLALRQRLADLRGRNTAVLIFAAASLAVFLLPVHSYKLLNKFSNGHYAFTNRGSGALWGSTARKAMPTTPQEDLAQKLYVFPDKAVCEKYASKPACDHWFYQLSDQLSVDKYNELHARHLSSIEIDREFTEGSIKLMLAHPFKMINGMFWEGIKLLFWEYPSWGMVILPKDVRSFYEQPFLYPVFLFGVNILSVFMFCGSCAWAWLRRREFVAGSRQGLNALAFTLGLIAVYMAAHSLFFLNERNALPIVPLFLVLWGCLTQCLSRKGAHEPA